METVGPLAFSSALSLTGCAAIRSGDDAAANTFGDDVAFLKEHVDVVVLEQDDSKVAVVPDYQGRVMTSSAEGNDGASYGWLNYKVVENGLLSDEQRKGQLEEHVYIFGGEERFWLGPEGGQFAIFFKPGAEFDFDSWFTPAAIDTETYRITAVNPTSVTFAHTCKLQNWTGTQFDVAIERTVRLLDRAAVAKALGADIDPAVKLVAYETDNSITNVGTNAWTRETGMLSIWMLGMYNPSPGTTVVIPFRPGPEPELGPKVNDTYFGKVPAEYLKVEDDVLFFKGDGTRRGKLGISPQRTLGIAGSYDATGNVLNMVTCNVPTEHSGYVNSMWELQKEPFSGDVINSYNDGSPGPGQPPLGPFYELETSSPAAPLKPGETMRHVQMTVHMTGPTTALDQLARAKLGAGLDRIKTALD